jgi:hypothetical protein
MGRSANTSLKIGLLCALTSCVGWQADRLPEGWKSLPRRAELAAVPFYPQDDSQCGPAALATLLSWSGDSVDVAELEPQVYTSSRRGSLQNDLVAAARRHGRVAYPLVGMEELLTEVAAGNPILVLQNLGLGWYPAWHYAVVIGFDLTTGQVILRSGRNPRKVMPFRVFERTWARSQRWALAVLPPGDLPASAEHERYLEAAIGLQRAQQWRAAARAYQAALERWEGSLIALMGLGNSRYAAGDLAAAEEAFRLASRTHPDAAAAFNNLAHVLSAQGRPREALEAAQRAVALGGPYAQVSADTLEEIRATTR